MALGLFRGLISWSSPGLAWLSDGQSVNSRSIRLHRLKAQAFGFLCHADRYAFFLPESENRNSAWINYQSCILSTASELYVRDLDVHVPSDCVAAPMMRAHRNALELMKISFEADTTSSTKRHLRRILKSSQG